jgi:hypothetical protein
MFSVTESLPKKIGLFESKHLERDLKNTKKNFFFFFLNLEKAEIPFSREIRPCDKIVKANLYSLKYLSLPLQKYISTRNRRFLIAFIFEP